jgi:nucleotide-binding universal stress UspA family protein
MYRQILMPLDGSGVAEQVIPHVEALAQAFRAHVIVLWVTPPVARVGGVPVASEERWQAEYDAEATPYLERIEQRLRGDGLQPTIERANGVPADAIIERAEVLEADLIAMMTHGRSGITRLALGSVAEDVVRHASCPVLLVRAR